ncbi:MAG: hypothetical protein HOP30_00200 [Cyclobacteriaceae bacterium]|nr:hypothetical protein [Cyclobacteriaceae bacterium]
MQSEDELKAENELLKLKLELEHGMKGHHSEGLSPAMENQWLNQIYNFEKLYKETPRVKVYDFIGRPDFVPIQSLPENEIVAALEALENAMQAKGVELSCLCEYPAATIYQFITEELFEHEMDGIRMEGMMTHFTYEEFHPNHAYDINRLITDFIDSLLTKQWNEQFDGMSLASQITFNGAQHEQAAMNAIILTFQEAHPSISFDQLAVEEIKFDLENGTGTAKATIAYTLRQHQQKTESVSGSCAFQMVMEYGYWCLTSIEIPGFGKTSNEI